MDLKPKITCHGDKDVYNKLNPELAWRLPRESTEWRRSYGRPAKTVKLKANFVRLSEGMLMDVSSVSSASSLHKQPFFHVYWTDCQDADEFKSGVKDSITDWMKKLRERNIVDWMIIQVVAQDSLRGNKPKLTLPRSTVFDKIKSDFGGKNSERIIQLWEPFKESQATRSAESWQNLVTKLRQLLLQSFNRHLGKFEDQVRSLRERRTEPQWSFTTYFLLHEELSFVFEMLGLYEEALIQYDEIDALLTQLVINSKYKEPLDCIDVFMRDCKCFDGVLLAKSSQDFLRQLIKTQEASYVDLRNYLFSRQCILLLKLKRRAWEIAQRLLEFLHNLVHELAMDELKISMPTGGASCCIILTSLEVLKACEEQCFREDIIYSLHFALLYQYAKQKLDELGSLCGLLPDTTPTEIAQQITDTLLSGIAKTQTDGDLQPNSPSTRLQKALSSKNAFQALYLDLTERAIEVFKNIGRARAAKVLGVDLAQFYFSRGEFYRAEPLLVDAYKMYKHERWILLATQCLVKLARCQKQLKHLDKYAASCSILACEQSLPSERRSHYTQELLQVLRDTMDSAQAIIVRAEPLLRVEDVQIDLMKGIGSVGESINVKLKLFSALEEEVTCGRISFSIQTNDLKRVGSIRSSKRNRATSPPEVAENRLSSAALSEEDLSDKPVTEDQAADGEALSEVDRVEKSRPLPPRPPLLPEVKSVEELNVLTDGGDSDCCLQCFNVPLKYGVNEYNLTAQLSEPGNYFLRQLCVEIGRLDFVWPQLSLSRQSRGFAIVCDPPQINWTHERDHHLLSGLLQQVTLSVSVESGSIADGSVLEISTNAGLTFEPVQSGHAIINCLMGKEERKTAPYSVAVNMIPEDDGVLGSSVAMVTLPALGPYARIDFNLKLRASLEKQSIQEEITEHKLVFSCKWLSPVVTAELSCLFHRPFSIRHVLLSSESNRFVQVIVSGINPIDLVISAPQLIITNCSSVKVTPLHSSVEYIIVNNQEVSFLWKVDCKEGSASALECEFRTSFSPKETTDSILSSSEKRNYLYDFNVDNTKTLYTISSRVEPAEDSGKLFAGSTYKWHITFTKLFDEGTPDTSQLMYDVDSDTNTWAVNGRKNGVLSIPTGVMATSEVVLSLIPQTGGNLAMPEIKLMKYVEKDATLPQAKNIEGAGVNASETLSNQQSPLILPFTCGQVYNKTAAVRVCVLPSNNPDLAWI